VAVDVREVTKAWELPEYIPCWHCHTDNDEANKKCWYCDASLRIDDELMYRLRREDRWGVVKAAMRKFEEDFAERSVVQQQFTRAVIREMAAYVKAILPEDDPFRIFFERLHNDVQV
jgi:hypothetical protein